jgi:hypothetical protein
MSRAFEILERVQQDRELFRVPPIARTEHASYEVISPETSHDDWPAFAREQELKLVQTLFLTAEVAGATRPRRIVFCGIDTDEGSRLLCARVGRVLAEQVSSPVCVVDASLRTTSANPLFDLAILDPLAASSLSGHDTERRSPTPITDNLSLASHDSVPSGGKPTLDDIRDWIHDLGSQFTHLVISAPPIGFYNDAAMLGQIADGVVLVLEANSTRRVAAQKSKQALEEANVNVLGTVLNNRTFPIPKKLYRRL